MWHELASNPRAISEIFKKPPSLEKVEISMIHLTASGPRMTMIIALSTFPDFPPRKWLSDKYQYNAITMFLLMNR